MCKDLLYRTSVSYRDYTAIRYRYTNLGVSHITTIFLYGFWSFELETLWILIIREFSDLEISWCTVYSYSCSHTIRNTLYFWGRKGGGFSYSAVYFLGYMWQKRRGLSPLQIQIPKLFLHGVGLKLPVKWSIYSNRTFKYPNGAVEWMRNVFLEGV